MLVVMFAANGDGDVTSRAAKHDGHVGREVVIAGRDDGRLTAVRSWSWARRAVRMTVKAAGDKAGAEAVLADAAAFFDTVKLGPAFGPAVVDDPVAVSALELAAAYKTDAAVADTRFKGRWVRVNGKVTDTADGAFTVDGDVAVRRAAKARMNVPVRPALACRSRRRGSAWGWWTERRRSQRPSCCAVIAIRLRGTRQRLVDGTRNRPRREAQLGEGSGSRRTASAAASISRRSRSRPGSCA